MEINETKKAQIKAKYDEGMVAHLYEKMGDAREALLRVLALTDGVNTTEADKVCNASLMRINASDVLGIDLEKRDAELIENVRNTVLEAA